MTAIVRARWGIAVATVDPWEVRTARCVRLPSPPTAAFVVTALLTRERPSFLVVPSGRRGAAHRLVLTAARERGVRVVPAPRPALVMQCASKLAVLLPDVGVDQLPQPVRAALALATATLHALPLRPLSNTIHARPRR